MDLGILLYFVLHFVCCVRFGSRVVERLEGGLVCVFSKKEDEPLRTTKLVSRVLVRLHAAAHTAIDGGIHTWVWPKLGKRVEAGVVSGPCTCQVFQKHVL